MNHPFNKGSNIVTLSKLLQCYLPDHHRDARECVERPAIINAYYWGGLSQVGGASGEVSLPDDSIVGSRQESSELTLTRRRYGKGR